VKTPVCAIPDGLPEFKPVFSKLRVINHRDCPAEATVSSYSKYAVVVTYDLTIAAAASSYFKLLEIPSAGAVLNQHGMLSSRYNTQLLELYFTLNRNLQTDYKFKQNIQLSLMMRFTTCSAPD